MINIIKIESLSKTYKSTSLRALSKVNLTINNGEILGILGPNGAGKTTLIKIICGLLLPDEGTVSINSSYLTKNNYHNQLANIGVVLEGARNLYWNITVRDNFYYFGAIKGMKKSDIRNNILNFSKDFKIQNLLDRKVRTLSLGQKQVVAIIAAMLHKPSLLILDESSNGVDIEAKANLIEILKSIQQNLNISILIASHDIDFIRRVSSRFIILSNGGIRDNFINDDISNEEIEHIYKISTN